MNLLLKKIIFNINKLKQKDRPLIIGIDGPTAAGKTTLADKLAKKLNKNNAFIFRLDWTLKSRKKREISLKFFKKNNINFYYEPEDHMYLSKTSSFLKKIKKFNNGSKKKIKLNLNKLYDRSGSAKNDLNIKTIINKNSIIIIEGHYTGYTDIYENLDINILLLSQKKELLKRKINRVKSYRSPKLTKQYFDLIDIPSFVNYLSRFGNNYSLIIDNSDYIKPIIKNHEYVGKWIDEVLNLETKVYQLKEIFKNLNLYESVEKDLFTENFVNKFSNFVISLDNFINKNFTLSIDKIKIDLYDYLKLSINKINKSNGVNKFNFKYTNNFHNLYYKKLPIIIGLNLGSKKNNVDILINIDNKNLKIIFHWIGGSEEIIVDRTIGSNKINLNTPSQIVKSNITKSKFTNENDLYCYIPTDFTFLDIVGNKFNKKIILINQEDFVISAAEIKEHFNSKNIYWIHRFAKFNERNFFKNILKSMGSEVFIINNYLFAFKSNNFNANKLFRKFFRKWHIKDKSKLEIIYKSNEDYDDIIDNDRKVLKNFVKNKTKNFLCLDGKIYFCPKKSLFNTKKKIYHDIFNLLRNKHRIIRKTAINYINENIPLNYLKSKILWEKEKSNTILSLKQFINISPTILNDLYFWMNLKNNNQAILAANIYDIRDESYDINAYLETAQKNSKPIVIQSSFNAIGQKEKYRNNINEGYLKLKRGPNEFIENTFNSARKLFLKNQKDFLFGIGLDHIDFRYDLPKGRIYRFLNSFKNINYITHFTLDSSYLLEDPTIKNFDNNKKKLIRRVLKNEIELLKNIKNNHIYDFEFCANELNYVENKKKIYLPNIHDINYFAYEFYKIINKSKIKYFNSRPKLIIGNLGTVHHGYDKNNYVKTETSKDWVDTIKKFNFVSAVLHGTSRSHPDVLRRATAGCYKINVAGDFLQILVSNLPQKLKEIVIDKNDNEKKKLYLIREKLDKIDKGNKHKIYNALRSKCDELMNLIQTPKLSINDINYFKYKSYNLDKKQASYIAKLAANSKISKKQPKSKKIRKPKFMLSPIEIQYGSKFKNLVKLFMKKKLYHFHLDVGDGELINRALDVSNKLKYIKNCSEKNLIHLHLMVADLDNQEKARKYIDYYANLGADYIGLLSRSFKNYSNLEEAILKVISLKKKPGIFIEVNEEFNNEITNLILKHKIDWIVFMGVPLGYGGQLFNYSILSNIVKAQNFFKKRNLSCDFEIDGGLTLEVIKALKNYNIKYYSGWSIISGENIQQISKKLEKVVKII